ncbi:MAG: GNAT family N-acetyltransferase [Flavobacteriaceae bacterium]
MNAIIETERTFMRPFTEDDTQAVFDFGSNKEVQKHTGDKLLESIDQAKNTIRNVWFADYKKYGYGRWAVVHKKDNKVIGFAGLKYLPEFRKTDIGYRFLPQYWGQGIATEVSLPIIKYGFEKLGLKEIIGIADPVNKGSIKVLQKIGLKYYKKAIYDEGTTKKYLWYKIKKEDY